MYSDLSYAVRSLARNKALAAGAVLTLALGIGVNTTMFAVTSGALLRPMLGMSAAERLVWVSSVSKENGRRVGMSYPDFVDYRAAATSVFTEMAAYSNLAVSLGSGGVPERLRGQVVTGSFFSTLGVTMAVGRPLAAADDVRGGPAVAVISDRLWRQRFGASPDVLRRPIVVNGRDVAVVGVVAPPFRGAAIGDAADMWLPMALWPVLRTSQPDLLESRTSSWLTVLARLRDGTGERQAQVAVSGISARLAARYPNDRDWTAAVSGPGSPVSPEGRRQVVPLAGLLLGVAALVLLIACANLANLLLARGAARTLEISIRASLGATRRRLVRQLLTESALLAAVGGAAGLLLAFWAGDLIVAAAGTDLDGLRATPDWRVVAFTAGAAALSVCAFGLVPALTITRRDGGPGLRAAPAAAGRTRLQGAFVVAQLALSLVLLLAAGLGLRSLQEATYLDLGFTPDNLTTASYDLVLQNYPEPRREAFRRDLLDRVRRLGGVESGAIANLAPLGGTIVGGAAALPDGTRHMVTFTNGVSPDYFATMRIPLVRGRAFTEQDRPGAPAVVIVNQTLARRLWDGLDPIGRALQLHLRTPITVEVVGVTRDAKYDEATEDPQPFVYLPIAQQPAFDTETVLVRTAAGAAPIGPLLERTIRQMDAALPVYDVHPYAAILHERVDKQRALSTLFSCFGALALLLAAIGLYGVMAHGAAQRTRELGVRLALGATPSQLAGLIARDGLRLGLIGTAIGAALALPLARVLGALVFGVHAADLAVIAAVCALLNAVVLAAALLPARRAARLDPVLALRAE